VVFHLSRVETAYLDLLSGMPFVKEARAVDDKLVATLDDPESQNPGLIRSLVEAGAEIRFVGELRHSLEDVYLQLVKILNRKPAHEQDQNHHP